MALAGPMANIIIAFIICSLPDFSYKATIVYTNLLIAIFNLIPICPLDGGRAVEAGLKCFLTDKMVDEIIHKVSNISLVLCTIIGIIGMVYLKNIAIVAILGYLWVIVIIENRRHRLKARVYKILEQNKSVKIG